MIRRSTLLAAAAVFSASLAQAAPVSLGVGETLELPADGALRQVVVSKEGVVSAAAPSDRRLRLTATAPGRTDVTLVTSAGRRTYEVEVTPVGAAAATALTTRLQAEAGLAGVSAEPAPSGLVVTGTARDLAAQGRAGDLARAAHGAETTNLVGVAAEQVVAVDVRFVAVSDTTLKALGFNFGRFGQGFEWAVVGPNSLQDFSFGRDGLSIDTTEPLQNAFNILLNDRKDGVLGMLSALSDAGLSQVLAQPTLLVRSGEQAEFLAGGDVPVPVPQAGGGGTTITVDYRPYGVRLAVEPYVLSQDRIVLKLAPEVSELDYANGVLLQGFNIPGFRRRSASTTVELGDGQSLVIAGLTYATTNSREQRIPGIGHLPVIGTLFKRAQNSQEKLELIIVATPRLVAPLEAGALADVGAAPTSPSFTDTLLNIDTVERRAARVGLSR